MELCTTLRQAVCILPLGAALCQCADASPTTDYGSYTDAGNGGDYASDTGSPGTAMDAQTGTDASASDAIVSGADTGSPPDDAQGGTVEDAPGATPEDAGGNVFDAPTDSAFSETEYPGIPDLQPIDESAVPLHMPIWAPLYELSGNTTVPGSPNVETTLFEPYNDSKPGWWYNILEEFRYGGIQHSVILTRASVNETAQWGYLKTNLFQAMSDMAMNNQFALGQFEDAGAWEGCYQSITGKAGVVDWSDATTMDSIFWDYMLKRFHDAVPKELWLRYNGRPVWVGWGAPGSVNMQGNVSRALRTAKAKFKAAYGEDLFMVVDQTWKKGDTTITGSGDADAVQSWFCCGKAGTFDTWNGYTIGVGVPGFQPITATGANQVYAADFSRNHGTAWTDILNMSLVSNNTSLTSNATMFVEEGYVDIREGAGSYRSPTWDYPSQYLEITREFLDKQTLTRRLEAEAADSFMDSTPTNEGGQYSSRALDVGALPGHGWYVGWVTANEWLKWQHVFLANGTYDVYARYASSVDTNNITLTMGGQTIPVNVSNSSGQYIGTKIASGVALSGPIDIQLTFLTAGISLDFIEFVRH